MANFNKVILVGRATRDAEVRAFNNGGKAAKVGFVVNNRKKDQSGAWQDDPCFIDVEAFNRGDYGKLADQIEERVRKGVALLVEGKLVMESWQDKATGDKRTKIKVVAEAVQFLDRRESDGSGEMVGAKAPAAGDDFGGEETPF